MKTFVLCVFVCILSQALGYPRYQPQFDKYNGFDDDMTDRDYDNRAIQDEDEKWVAGLYDKEESLVKPDPNSVWPGMEYSDDEDVDGPSGWNSIEDGDDSFEDAPNTGYQGYQGDMPYDDDYVDEIDDVEDELDDVEDELDYVEDDVEFNEDRIYELEDDLDYDEEKIERMDKRIRKLSKSLKSLQNLVNAIETSRLENFPRQSNKLYKDDY